MTSEINLFPFHIVHLRIFARIKENHSWSLWRLSYQNLPRNIYMELLFIFVTHGVKAGREIKIIPCSTLLDKQLNETNMRVKINKNKQHDIRKEDINCFIKERERKWQMVRIIIAGQILNKWSERKQKYIQKNEKN